VAEGSRNPQVKRAIFVVATGPHRYAEMALGLARSLQLVGDETPRIVLTDNSQVDWSRYFAQVVKPFDDGTNSVYYAKLNALEATDADQVLFIDSDALAFKRLDPIFELCQGRHFAAVGRWETSGTWYEKSIEKVCQEQGIEALPRINTGVLYYERSSQAEEIIALARNLKHAYREIGFELLRRKESDEPSIALAMAKTGMGAVLPQGLNLNESGVGLIGKLHLDVLSGQCRYITGNPHVRLVEPYIFHAHYFSKLKVYWNELKKLEKLERYRIQHGPRYMSRGLRLRRSIEKRYLKLTGKL